MLGPLAVHGGFTPTIALLAGSPAIDSGDDAACPATDQRGVPRPIGSHSDIGTFEYVPPPIISFEATGGARIDLVYQPQKHYVIEISTNLLNWSASGTNVSGANGAFSFQDQDALKSGYRFYRAHSQ
jgi:hypothetical protein